MPAHNHPAPQHVDPSRPGPRSLDGLTEGSRTGVVQDPASGVPRTPPLGSWANRHELRSLANFVLWRTYTHLRQEYAAFVTWPVDAAFDAA